MKPDAEKTKASRCSRCGAGFQCGAGTGNCWCAKLPPIAPVPGRSCLCPRCLDEEARRLKDVAG
ncbi:MAG TPA: cysteine-rich CWC family protein [Burkholderiales bacterium]|nr:cysteine-rich CWC family protein [Burkholderiales bacterium]